MTLELKLLRRSSGNTYSVDNMLLDRGNRLFVHGGSGSDASNRGQDPDAPYATLAYAIAQASANQGDKIYLLPGHSETRTAAITVDKAGLSIIGLGQGQDQPEFTCDYAGDLFNITAADCLIENVYFQEATAAATAQINLAAARATIRGCTFECGANDLDNITVPAGGAGSRIESCTFRITANGPDSAITVEGGCDNLAVLDNYFDGGSTTNTWDDAAIDLGSTTPVNVRIQGNTFAYGVAVLSTGATPRVQGGNHFVRGARPCAGASITLYASPSVTGTKSGTAEDPTTLKDAVDLAAAGDIVKLYPGTHTITVALALDVANVTVEPVDYRPGSRGSGAEIANDTDDIRSILVTAAGCAVRGIRFTKGIANTTDGTALIACTSGGDYLSLVDCVFDLEARTNADAVSFATGTKGHLIDNCFFTDGAAGKAYIAWACSTMEVKNCMFDSTAAICLVSEQAASPGDGSFIHDNLIASSGSTGAYMTWQSSPGKNVTTSNRVFGSGADADGMGDDGDLDAWAYGNFRDGDTAGATTALTPSVS